MDAGYDAYEVARHSPGDLPSGFPGCPFPRSTMSPINESRREWIRVSLVFPFMDEPTMDRQTFRKNVVWGWVAAGASLVPASALVDASQPATTMLAMISCAPAAADPSPNPDDNTSADSQSVRAAGHLFAPPPLPTRWTDWDTGPTEPTAPSLRNPRVHLAPHLQFTQEQKNLPSDILRRLPKTDPLSDDTSTEPLPPEPNEPEPGILPSSADSALQLDDPSSVTLQPPVLDAPTPTNDELLVEEYTPTELAPDEIVPDENVPAAPNLSTAPGERTVELGPPVEIPQSDLESVDLTPHYPAPPILFASPGSDAVEAESLSTVAGSLMHLPPVEPEAPAPSPLAELAPPTQPAPPRPVLNQNVMATAHRVEVRLRKAESLMARGACFAARAEVLQALKTITQALDEREGTRRHGDALAFALRAFQEAGELTPRGAGLASPVNLELTIRSHRTPVLWNENVNRLTPVAAQQRYMAYAQEQLTEACRGDMSAAETLYVLARINTVLENEKPESTLLCLPQAMVMYRVTLELDPRHGRAANELGVLLAECGRFTEARDVLMHSISVTPTPESWHNLSVVHARLGNAELAQKAQQESVAAMPPNAPQSDTPSQPVRWVDPEMFRAESPTPSATHTRR